MALQLVNSISSSMGTELLHRSVSQYVDYPHFVQQIAGTGVVGCVNWNSARVVTPGAMRGYVTPTHIELFNCGGHAGVQLFRSNGDSQGLIYDGDHNHAFGASVTTSIRESTPRDMTSKSTHIQYDKNRYADEDADFEVDHLNYRGYINYQGGHLIDYKFGTEYSHTTEHNYVPMHFFYNSPIKEYLVKQCEAYVEIPLYSPNPPKIGVKSHKDTYHDIPVGIIFIQINENVIQAVYYFPNNNMCYKELGDRYPKKAENIVPFFQLNPQLYPLIFPALIFGQGSQVGWERERYRLMEHITDGMLRLDAPDAEQIVRKLSHKVLNGETIHPQDCFVCHPDPDQQHFFNTQPLEFPLQILGEFLVNYGLRNALKSEVISLNTRLVFCSVITDLLLAYALGQMPQKALAYVNSMKQPFNQVLTEMNRGLDTLDRTELLYLANVYQKMADPVLDHLSLLNEGIYQDGPRTYFVQAIAVLRIFVSKTSLSNCDWAFLNCIEALNETLNYLYTGSIFQEELVEPAAFLKSLRYPTLSRLHQLQQGGIGIYAKFQTNINQVMSMRSSVGYEHSVFASLGFPEDDSDDEEVDEMELVFKSFNNLEERKENFHENIALMRSVFRRPPSSSFQLGEDQILGWILHMQRDLRILIENGFDESCFEEEGAFLKELRLDAILLLKNFAGKVDRHEMNYEGAIDLDGVVGSLSRLGLPSDDEGEEEISFSDYVVSEEPIEMTLHRIYGVVLNRLAEEQWDSY